MFLWKTVFLVSILCLSFSNSLFISCLMFIAASMVISISFLHMSFNWLMYSMIILYLGGMMILFTYMCSVSSVSKIESGNLFVFLAIMLVIFSIYWAMPDPDHKCLDMPFSATYSLYLLSGQLILLLLGVYLTVGLLASIFFIEKLQGPLKPFYDK